MATDEDEFVFPAQWYEHRHPRRTSAGVTPFVPDLSARDAVAPLLDFKANPLRRALASPTTEESVRAAAVAWSEGRSEAPAVGAAAVLAVLGDDNARTGELLACVDVWLVEGGLSYAAEAAVHLMSLVLAGDFPGPDRYVGDSGVRHLRPGERGEDRSHDLPRQVAVRVRWALATAADDEYATVVAELGRFRSGHPYARAATSVLVPERHDWVERDVADAVADNDGYRAKILTVAVHTADQAAALAGLARTAITYGSRALLTTMIDGVGPAVGPVLLSCTGNNPRRVLLELVARLPGDEVMRGLIDRVDSPFVPEVLAAAAERFPVRAMRLLGEAGDRPAVAELLRAHVRAHPDLAARTGREPVRALIDADVGTVAPANAVPAPLVDPPWLARPPERVVIRGLTCADQPTVDWAPGEREQWFVAVGDPRPGTPWDRVADQALTRSRFPYRLFGHAPDPVARRVLREWDPDPCVSLPRHADRFLRVAVARFEVDALDLVLRLAHTPPPAEGRRGNRHEVLDAAIRLLQPFAAPQVALLMAGWFRRPYAREVWTRPDAEAWLRRHPVAAARALVPAALGEPGAARADAEAVLRHLSAHGHTGEVRSAAASHGPVVAEAIDRMLATDPRVYDPPWIPPVPDWATPAVLPPVRLRGGALLPAAAMTNLVILLALSTPADPFPGMAEVIAACAPDSLAAFGWSLFQQSMLHRDGTSEWTIGALGVVGDDETVRRLTPVLLGVPHDDVYREARAGVESLAAIGTRPALESLDLIARKSRFRAVRDAARQQRDVLRDRAGPQGVAHHDPAADQNHARSNRVGEQGAARRDREGRRDAW